MTVSVGVGRNPQTTEGAGGQREPIGLHWLFQGLDRSQFHGYCGEVKNITLSIEDDLYERSRVLAAQRKTTVTGLVREYLRRLSDADDRREQARQAILDMIGTFDCRIGRMPSREERNARR